MKASLLALTTTTGSCVVSTTPTQFQDPNQCVPFFVADQATPPIDKIFVIDPSKGTAEFEATVALKSCALTKAFVGRTFLDGKPFFIREDVFPATGDDTRLATITVPVSATLSDGCHRVELLASSAFAPGDVRAPAQPGDLAYIVWFLDVHTPGTPDHSLTECNR